MKLRQISKNVSKSICDRRFLGITSKKAFYCLKFRQVRNRNEFIEKGMKGEGTNSRYVQ
jgi:hypothetical protein